MKTTKLLCALALVAALGACSSMSQDTRLTYDALDYIIAEDYAAAERTLNEAYRINPQNPYVLLNQGVVYQRTDRIDLARQKFNEAIRYGQDAKLSRSNNQERVNMTVADVARGNLANLQ